MNASLLAQNAYSNHRAPTRSARAVEYDAFSRITAAIKNAETFPQRTEALNQNRRLWTLLATSVADDDNKLPPELRASILSLAEFTFQHTRKVLAGNADTEALIEINGSIMQGLRGTKAAAP